MLRAFPSLFCLGHVNTAWRLISPFCPADHFKMENIAIESKNQSILNKNVKKIRRKLKNGVDVKKNVRKLKARPERGVVYLGHIPHGFYEDGIRAYAAQFGRVTRVRVARSKRTGASKGYAFVEFRNPEVAKIFAETADNYLMYNRLLKCHYIAPEKRHPKMFKATISALRFPKQKHQVKDTELKNAAVDPAKEEKRMKKAKEKMENIQSFLKQKGLTLNIMVNNPENNTTVMPKNEPVVLEIDESDDEIKFVTPPHVIKVYKKSGKVKNGKTGKKLKVEK